MINGLVRGYRYFSHQFHSDSPYSSTLYDENQTISSNLISYNISHRIRGHPFQIKIESMENYGFLTIKEMFKFFKNSLLGTGFPKEKYL